MNKSALLSLIVLTGFSVQPSMAADSDHQAIQNLLESYEEALNNSDAQTIGQLYTKSGVQMAPDAPAAVGQADVLKAYEATFDAIKLNLTFTVDDIKVFDGQHAVLRSHSNGTLKINGTDADPMPAAFKELFVMQKNEQDEWRFSHYSFSEAPL